MADSKRAFSLIEVLVAISIILLLASLVFFAARAGVKRSKETASLNNLSQIGKAVLIYASQHDDWFPPYLSYANVTTEPGSGAKYWVDSMEPFLGNKEIVFSPLDPYKGAYPPDSSLNSYVSRPYMSYEHGTLIGKKIATGLFQISQNSVDEPANEMYMWESGIEKAMRGTVMIEIPMAKTNLGILYFDGHTKRIPFITLYNN